jgi:drug/metabolite transporter (DMT)-like permease
MAAVKPDAQRLASGPALGPGVVAATSFALSDTLAKLVFAAGGDVLTLALIRGVIGLGILFVFLRLGPAPVPSTRSRSGSGCCSPRSSTAYSRPSN